MRVTIKVGDIGVDIRGLKMSRKQVLDLVGEVAGIALALAPDEPAPDDRPPLGFTALIERLPDDLAAEPYTDDE